MGARQLSPPSRKQTMNPTTVDVKSSYIGEEVLSILASMKEGNRYLTAEGHGEGWMEVRNRRTSKKQKLEVTTRS